MEKSSKKKPFLIIIFLFLVGCISETEKNKIKVKELEKNKKEITLRIDSLRRISISKTLNYWNCELVTLSLETAFKKNNSDLAAQFDNFKNSCSCNEDIDSVKIKDALRQNFEADKIKKTISLVDEVNQLSDKTPQINSIFGLKNFLEKDIFGKAKDGGALKNYWGNKNSFKEEFNKKVFEIYSKIYNNASILEEQKKLDDINKELSRNPKNSAIGDEEEDSIEKEKSFDFWNLLTLFAFLIGCFNLFKNFKSKNNVNSEGYLDEDKIRIMIDEKFNSSPSKLPENTADKEKDNKEEKDIPLPPLSKFNETNNNNSGNQTTGINNKIKFAHRPDYNDGQFKNDELENKATSGSSLYVFEIDGKSAIIKVLEDSNSQWQLLESVIDMNLYDVCETSEKLDKSHKRIFNDKPGKAILNENGIWQVSQKIKISFGF